MLVSLIALKAMTSETTARDSGAHHVAPGGPRRRAQLGYRYCWLRDSILRARALLAAATPTRRSPSAAFSSGWAPGTRSTSRSCRRRGRAPADGVRAGFLPATRVAARARQERRVRAVPARRLWRGGRRLGDSAPRGVLGQLEAGIWPRWRAIVEHVETIWRLPDDGIWEARGPQRPYTYSKVMAWVVFDRAAGTGRAVRARRPARAVDGDPRRDSRGGVVRATTRSGGPSRSTTGRRSSTQACSTSHSSASCREATTA